MKTKLVRHYDGDMIKLRTAVDMPHQSAAEVIRAVAELLESIDSETGVNTVNTSGETGVNTVNTSGETGVNTVNTSGETGVNTVNTSGEIGGSSGSTKAHIGVNTVNTSGSQQTRAELVASGEIEYEDCTNEEKIEIRRQDYIGASYDEQVEIAEDLKELGGVVPVTM